MGKSAKGLVEWAISKIGSAYMFGYTGIVSESAIQAKTKQYPAMYDAEYIAKCRKNIGRYATDCSGLIDSYLGVDNSADGYLALAKEKGTVSSFPGIPGYLVHKSHHVGVYIGGGYVVEARGVDYGVVKTKLDGRGWLNWSKCPLVDYSQGGEDMLKSGDKNSAVGNWQKALNRCGAKLAVDSTFGPQTVLETKSFQAAHGLTVTGEVDWITAGHMWDSLTDKAIAAEDKISQIKKIVG